MKGSIEEVPLEFVLEEINYPFEIVTRFKRGEENKQKMGCVCVYSVCLF